MNTWNKDTNIVNDEVRVVKFNLDTDQGEGYVTVMVNKGITIDDAKIEVLNMVKGHYSNIEVTGYEILEIIPDEDTPLH